MTTKFVTLCDSSLRTWEMGLGAMPVLLIVTTRKPLCTELYSPQLNSTQ